MTSATNLSDWKGLAATRSQQVVSLLLTQVPVAERMLLYNVALVAWSMLPLQRKWIS